MDLIPDINEVIRYLGYRGSVPDDSVRAEIGECIGDLQKEVTPRFVYEKFPLSVKTEQGRTERRSCAWEILRSGAGIWPGTWTDAAAST